MLPTNLPAVNKKPWHKTPGGIIFLSLISIVLIAAILFGLMVVYYTWTLKYGDAEKLVKQFSSQKFTNAAAVLDYKPSTVKQDVKTLIRDHNPAKGTATAPVTIIAFVDFQCPFSHEGYSLFRQIENQYQSAVQIIFKHFPVESLHPQTNDVSLASTCAQEQNKFWEYYDLIFTNKQTDEVSLLNYASQTGMNTIQFQQCLTNKKYQTQIDQDIQDGLMLQLRGTPTYFINQVKIEGVVDKQIWDEVMVEEMQKSTSKP